VVDEDDEEAESVKVKMILSKGINILLNLFADYPQEIGNVIC
jgi:hypothetical protein